MRERLQRGKPDVEINAVKGTCDTRVALGDSEVEVIPHKWDKRPVFEVK